MKPPNSTKMAQTKSSFPELGLYFKDAHYIGPSLGGRRRILIRTDAMLPDEARVLIDVLLEKLPHIFGAK